MAQTETPSTPRPNPWRRRVVWGLGGWLLACALGWLALPPVLKWQLETRGSAALGSPLSVDRVDLKPWSLELAVHGLRIGATTDEAPDAPALFTAQRLYIDAELQSLFRWAPVIDALELDQPRLHLTHQGAGRYNVDGILAKLLAPQPTATEPPRFALYNIRVRGGSIDFEDQPVQARHHLEALELQIPFLSNLASKRDVATQPKLAFVLNGSAFETTASATPFAAQPHTEVHLRVPSWNLEPYLPYWPKNWPLRPSRGHLETDLTLTFDQKETPQVRLSGQLALSDWAVSTTGPQAAPLFGWQRLVVDVADLRPLERVVELKQIVWTAPEWHVRRHVDGQLQWAQLLAAWQRPAQAAVPPPAPATAAPPAPGWQLRVQSVALDQGAIRWQDTSTTPQTRLGLDDLVLRAGPVQWPQGPATRFEAQGRLARTPLTLTGEGAPSGVRAELTWKDAPLGLVQPYLAQVLTPAVQGRVGGSAAVKWAPASSDQAQILELTVPRLTLSDFKVGPAQKPHLSWTELALDQLTLDLTQRRAQLDRLSLTQPFVALDRAADGRWMFEHWLPQPASEIGNAAPVATPITSPPPVWQAQLNQLAVQKGSGTLLDATRGRTVRLQWQDLQLAAQNLQPLAPKPNPSPVKLAVQLGGARGEPGKLAYEGVLRLPNAEGMDTQLKGRLRLERLPLHPLEPYMAAFLNLDLVRADLGYQGDIDVGLPRTGLALQLAGQASLDDFRASTVNPSEELLDWKTLQLRGLQLSVQGGQLARLQVDETLLSDYYARVVINHNGQINLQQLVKTQVSGPGAPATAGSPTAGGASTLPTKAPQTAPITFGPITLVNGRVFFSDRFIKPNYSANLSELTGRLGAFSNQPSAGSNNADLAELDIRGRAEGTASLQINGRLNPLATPLALDIKGVVRELELPPLSPYSVKYAGYGIERGKLSVDVSYKVDPTGQLEASNQIVLNQLRFGERVEGSEAPNLPVKLAVALLADRNGVIDINLPVSGSLNDPEFRLGPIVFKLVLNLIGKAITSPFALIASAFGGGGEDLQDIPFPAGRSQLDSEGQQRLDRVAKALQDRPALQLTVTGRSALEAERNGYRRARLDNLVAAEKRRRDARAGNNLEAAAAHTPEEYPSLLRAVYRRADISKPRNAIGMTKDLPVPDMEALLLASIPVTENEMRELAVARGVAVKDQLVKKQIPLDRLFLGSPSVSGGNTAVTTGLKLEPR